MFAHVNMNRADISIINISNNRNIHRCKRCNMSEALYYFRNIVFSY